MTVAILNVTRPIDYAIARTRRLLFERFDLAKWLSFGVIVFLATMFEGGCAPPFGFRFPGPPFGATPAGFLEGLGDVFGSVGGRLGVVLTVGGILFVVSIALGALLLWLRSRGHMMLIRAVALNDVRIEHNWRTTGRLANSLFLFRLVLSLIGLAWNVSVVAGAVIALYVFRERIPAWSTFVMTLLPFVAALLCGNVVLWLIVVFLRSFVSVLMYRFDLTCLAAWRGFLTIAGKNVGPLCLFLLIRFAYHVAFRIIALFATCATCCIAAVPVLGQALFSPFYVFDCAYSIYVLESLGPEYRTIPPLEDMAPHVPGPPEPPRPTSEVSGEPRG